MSRSKSHTRSKSRDKRRRKERSTSPKPTRIHIGRLTRNVTKDHIIEIFSTYGEIKSVDYPLDRLHPTHARGFAYIEFAKWEDAESAMKHMDGGQIDGNEVTAAPVLAPKRPPMRRFSPPQRNNWNRRRSPPRFRRRSPMPRFDRRRRSRSRSPRRRRRSSGSSSSRSRSRSRTR